MKAILIGLLLMLSSLVVLPPASISAYDVINAGGSGVCSQSGAANSAVCQGDANNACQPSQNSPCPDDVTSLISKVTVIIAVVAGIAAVIMIIVSGLRFMFSGGEQQKVAGAKNSLMYAIIGLVIIALASAIVSFIVGNL